MTKPIGVYGGTFDPVHFGHLRVAYELYQDLGLAEVRMIPARVPPHREAPETPAADRADLLEAALVGQTALRIDRRELDRPGPSYTIDTLTSLRTELGRDQPLCLIMGGDAFAGLDQWHQWRAIVEAVHLVIAYRPGWDPHALQGNAKALLEERGITDPTALGARAAGSILPWEVTQLDISASRIRALIAAGKEPRYLLPDAVWQLIQANGLYRTEQE